MYVPVPGGMMHADHGIRLLLCDYAIFLSVVGCSVSNQMPGLKRRESFTFKIWHLFINGVRLLMPHPMYAGSPQALLDDD